MPLQAFVDLVPPVRAAGVADGHEVAADLGGRDARQAGELMGVDVGRLGALQFIEQAPVETHARDGLPGYHAVRSGTSLAGRLLSYSYTRNAVKQFTIYGS